MKKQSSGSKSANLMKSTKTQKKPVNQSQKRALTTAKKNLIQSPFTQTTRKMTTPGAKKPNVFFKITRGGKDLGVVEMKLYDDIVPRTTENFRQLCLGSKKIGSTPLHYKGSKFHRVIPNFMVQAGDFTRGDGRGGISIYGERFPDEQNGLRLKHNRPGLLSMANAGPNTNGSQFFLTTVATPWLDMKHVVFGEIVKGYDVVKMIESSPTNSGDTPMQPIVIADCGEVV